MPARGERANDGAAEIPGAAGDEALFIDDARFAPVFEQVVERLLERNLGGPAELVAQAARVAERAAACRSGGSAPDRP